MKIRYKLLLPILLTVLLVFSALSYLNYRTSRKQLSREIEKRAQGMLESTVFELEGEIQKIEGVAKGIGTTLESIEIESENEVSSLIQNFLEHTPEAFGSAVAFRPGSFSSTRELVAPYYFRRDNRFIFKDIGTEDYNYPNWEWFKNPISSGQPIWGEPYFDEGGGDIWMITYSYPFLKDGSVWGVATVDVSMSELTDNIERIKVGKTGGAFLLSENGTFLSIFQKNLIHVSTIFDLAKKHDDEDLKKLGDEMLEGRGCQPVNRVHFNVVVGSDEVGKDAGDQQQQELIPGGQHLHHVGDHPADPQSHDPDDDPGRGGGDGDGQHVP